MGRHTHDIFAGRWPTATDPNGFADRMNNIPKYVLSHTLSEPTWTNTTVLAGDDVADRIRDLTRQPGRDILQYGYGPVTRLLIDHGLLDELHIWLHPLLVGNFDPSDQLGAADARSRLQLNDVRRFDSGLVILRRGNHAQRRQCELSQFYVNSPGWLLTVSDYPVSPGMPRTGMVEMLDSRSPKPQMPP